MRPRVVVLGASDHARIVADVVRAAGRAEVAGFVDDNAALHGRALDGAPVLGGLDRLEALLREGVTAAIPGVGESRLRERFVHRAQAAGLELATAIHPLAFVSPHARVGAGSLVAPGGVVCTGAQLGVGVIINTSASVDHDCRLGDYVQVAPGARLGGRVTVGRHGFVGMGASIIQTRTVGANSVIGAGAAVVRDVPPNVVAIGVPARVLKTLPTPPPP